ncbi:MULTISPECIES: acetoacetate decarboxylase family protein [unclassified Geodermatophilus]|uniref:acetoacetate decarboxylase family protein n=1 Tax=unclassified Geodermatophilus TaxID=2637632 RepID=UPI003EEDCF92
MTHRDEPDDWDGPTPQVRVGDRSLRLPLRYSDSSCFAAVHPASYDAVAAALPASDLRPARWTDGRALVSVAAFRYRAVTTADSPAGLLAPYGEVSVGVVVTRGPAPRLLPVLRRRLSMFVLHLPVTTREARDAGAALWGFPKFVADMDFAEERPVRRVTLAEGGTTVLELAVRGRGPVVTDRRPAAMYTTLGGQLLETVVPMAGRLRVAFGADAGELRLGDHPVADSLRGLGIAPRPLAVFDYLDHRSVLPAGRPVGPAPAYSGHRGADREAGRFTVRYPHTPPLDLSAPVPVAT